MAVKFGDIELAFEFVSGQPSCMNSAVICRKAGRAYYASGMGDTDEDFPEDATAVDYLLIPHKNDLDLGVELVRAFVMKTVPELEHEVDEIFCRKGAYGRFRDLLHAKGLAEAWYEYEAAQTKQVLLAWCHDNNVELTEDASP